jgi:hypothetical protein
MILVFGPTAGYQSGYSMTTAFRKENVNNNSGIQSGRPSPRVFTNKSGLQSARRPPERPLMMPTFRQQGSNQKSHQRSCPSVSNVETRAVMNDPCLQSRKRPTQERSQRSCPSVKEAASPRMVAKDPGLQSRRQPT